jgi:16S rRNA (guanine527-N7)-methyltransferase
MEEFKSGLVCLKGGDLTEEIAGSRLRPHIREISSFFPEPYFEQKYVLYVPLK